MCFMKALEFPSVHCALSETVKYTPIIDKLLSVQFESNVDKFESKLSIFYLLIDSILMEIENTNQEDCDLLSFLFRCDRFFKDEKLYKSHMKKHNKPSYDCSQCHKKYEYRHNLLTHMVRSLFKMH